MKKIHYFSKMFDDENATAAALLVEREALLANLTEGLEAQLKTLPGSASLEYDEDLGVLMETSGYPLPELHLQHNEKAVVLGFETDGARHWPKANVAMAVDLLYSDPAHRELVREAVAIIERHHTCGGVDMEEACTNPHPHSQLSTAEAQTRLAQVEQKLDKQEQQLRSLRKILVTRINEELADSAFSDTLEMQPNGHLSFYGDTITADEYERRDYSVLDPVMFFSPEDKVLDLSEKRHVRHHLSEELGELYDAMCHFGCQLNDSMIVADRLESIQAFNADTPKRDCDAPALGR